MSSKILAVFEGRKTEPRYFKVLADNYLSDTGDHLICAFENCIYDLWAIVRDDPDLDLVEVIRNRNEANKKELRDISRSEISQVYLFFDLDCHDDKYTEEKIYALTDFFSNETENGAIFISYPMVEALRHFNQNFDFHEKMVPAFENIKYKKIVHEECEPAYSDVKKIARSDLNKLLRSHIIKSNYICGRLTNPIECKDFSRQNIKYVDQTEIFTAQLRKFINTERKIAVLSGFPIFLYQYFGEALFDRIALEANS